MYRAEIPLVLVPGRGMENKRIKGGFYLKARKSQEGWIAHAPPHVREIWDYLLHHANYKDHGKIKRGSLLTTYQEIADGLSWKIGYRTQRYTRWQIEKALKLLKRESMINPTKTARGLIIQILNYNRYQNPENYEGWRQRRNNEVTHESDNESHTEGHTQDTPEPSDSNDTEVLETDEGHNEGHNEGHKRATSEPHHKGKRFNNVKDSVLHEDPKKGSRASTPPYSEIVDYLNEKVGTDFRSTTKETRRYIKARFTDGFSLDDFKAVIDLKVTQWKGDPKMQEYLRPKTLFCTNFESYLQAAGPTYGKPNCKKCWYNRGAPQYVCRIITERGSEPPECKSYKPMD